MWRALASFAIGCVLGSTFLGIFSFALATATNLVTGGVTSTSDAQMQNYLGSTWGWTFPFEAPWPLVFVIFTLIVAVAALFGLTVLHRTISIAIIRTGVKEAELVQRAQTSDRQRSGVVRAADVERTRIERDLHDGVQPRLVSIAMTLGLAQQKMETDTEGAKQLVNEAHASAKAAITELRQLARGIYASVLDDRGLDSAISALASRSHIPVHLDIVIEERCSRVAEAAVYFAIAESLTNSAKHSRASECRVVVRQRENGVLWARAEDNGIGGAKVLPGGGLDGITNRVVAAGGTVRLESPVGGPTTLEVSVPCAS